MSVSLEETSSQRILNEIGNNNNNNNNNNKFNNPEFTLFNQIFNPTKSSPPNNWNLRLKKRYKNLDTFSKEKLSDINNNCTIIIGFNI